MVFDQTKSGNETTRKEEIKIITVIDTEEIIDKIKTPTDNLSQKCKSRKRKVVKKLNLKSYGNCKKRKVLNVR